MGPTQLSLPTIVNLDEVVDRLRKKAMAEIKLSQLGPAGSELLQDSESFLTELGERQLENVVGGHSKYELTI